MKTTNDFIKEMESSNILLSREYTFQEYVSELLQFQPMVCQMIAGDEFHEGMRFDEACFILERTARQKQLRDHPAVYNAVQTMRRLEKEMAVTMSGAKGEKVVSNTLSHLERPNTRVFRNVYITDGVDETELDAVVLTDNGFVILEVKKIKTDITITEDGRLVFSGNECYDKVPLVEKMALKRRLLRKCVEKAVAERGLDIPVYVDSFIVFSAPKDKYIRIDDRCRREKHCFRTGINKRLENYIGCAFYKANHLEALGSILSEMESNVKRFEKALNYDEVRHNIAEALSVLQDVSVEQSAPEQNSAKIVDLETRKKRVRRIAKLACAMASALGCLFIPGSAIALAMNSHQE